MSLHTLIAKIVLSDKYRKNYPRLLLKSVRSQFSLLKYDRVFFLDIDWGYLISCASIFVRGQDSKTLDMAYRICQTIISETELEREYKNAAASIFNALTNISAINLSKARGLISDEYMENVPFGIRLDVKKKQFANTIIEGDDIITLNDFQKEVYSEFSTNQAISISAPTSAGKSFVLLHIISEYIRENPFAKIVYIVPTRALIQQVELDMRQHLKNLHLSAEISSVPVLPERYDNKPCIFVFTQERLQWVLNENADVQIELIVVDEAHKIGDRARGILLQQVLQQISYQNDVKFLFASPMSENPEALLKLVKPTVNQKKIISEIVTVNQNLIWISKAGTATSMWNVELLAQGEKYKLGCLECERITSVAMRLPILAYRLSAGQIGNLLYVNGAADAEKVAQQLKSMVLNDSPMFRPSKRVLDLIRLIKKTIHPNYALAETLKGGIAFHYGNMPLAVRNEIEELFKIGDISFLVCTSTLIEGVNLPAKSIYIRGPQKGKNSPMDEMDFWNLAGRAGRQGKEFQGNIICLDAGDDKVWKNGTPEERRKYRIVSTVDTIVKTQSEELVNYIKNDGEIFTFRTELDYAYTYFLDTYFRYNKVSNSYIANLYGREICREIDAAFDQALKNIDLPSNILTKNQGVNPVAQQRLYNYFLDCDREDDELIPPYPEDDDAMEKYMHIIGLTCPQKPSTWKVSRSG